MRVTDGQTEGQMELPWHILDIACCRAQKPIFHKGRVLGLVGLLLNALLQIYCRM